MENFALTVAAEDDLTGIWLYTNENWGFDQAEKYYAQLYHAAKQLLQVRRALNVSMVF